MKICLKHLLSVFALLISAGTICAAEIEPEKLVFSGGSGKPPVGYKTGDEFEYRIDYNYSGRDFDRKYMVYWKRVGDDGIVHEGTVPLDKMPIVRRDKFTKPGFVRYFARLQHPDGKPVYTGRRKWIYFEDSVGADVKKVMPSEEPADFDLFWKKAAEELRQLPLTYKMEEVKNTALKGVKTYKVEVSCTGGRPVTGYLQIPEGKSGMRYPAQLSFFGYSVIPKDQQKPPRWAAGNRISLVINAHGFEPGRETAYYEEFFKTVQSNGHKYGFDPVQNRDPRQSYFFGMAMRAARAVGFLRSLPQWDGKELTVSGTSQGGAQAIWAAALADGVTRCTVRVPWLCNIAGHAKQQRIKSSFVPEYSPGLDYIDAAFHARRIKCPVTVSRAGLGDGPCPPGGVMSMFNNLQVPAEIHWYQAAGHARTPKGSQRTVISNNK